jgi:hypothetical protein
MNPSEILADARAMLDETVQLRRRIHRHRMVLNESALATGVAMHAAVALSFLERKGVVS